MSQKAIKLILAALSASVAAGCVQQRADMDVRANTQTSNGLLDQSVSPMPAANKEPINSHSGVFLGSQSILNEHGDPLPSRLQRDNGITINNGASSVSLQQVASIIATRAKIPVVIGAAVPMGATSPSADPAPRAANQPQAADAATPAFASGPIPKGFQLDQALAEIQSSKKPATAASVMNVNSEADNGSMTLNFSGKLSDLLDLVSATFNVEWRYDRGKIILDTVITRNFDVPALPLATSMGFTVGNTDSKSAGQNAKTNMSVNVFDELKAALGKLVGESAYSINQSTGVVTVTGTPVAVARVRDYLSDLNMRLKDQVALSVKVYSVTVKDSEDFSLDLKGVFANAGNGLTLAGAGTASAITGGGSLGWALVNSNSQFNGSQAALKALSERGDVSVMTTASLTTLNGQPVPLQVGQDRDYIKKIDVQTVATTTGTQTSTSIEPAEISEGFALQMLPRIERNGDVLLQYGVNITKLVGASDGFDERVIGTSTVQLKRLDQRNFIQNVRIPHDKTLVLAGFEQVQSSTANSGIGHPLFPFLGGSSVASKQRQVMVIMITPTVLK